jgi:hypothetical protein
VLCGQGAISDGNRASDRRWRGSIGKAVTFDCALGETLG